MTNDSNKRRRLIISWLVFASLVAPLVAWRATLRPAWHSDPAFNLDRLTTEYAHRAYYGMPLVRPWNPAASGIYLLSDFDLEQLILRFRHEGLEVVADDSLETDGLNGIPIWVHSGESWPMWLDSRAMVRLAEEGRVRRYVIRENGAAIGELEVYPFSNTNTVLLMSQSQFGSEWNGRQTLTSETYDADLGEPILFLD